MTDKTTFGTLASKGDGVLVKRGSVWTYPTAEMDRSGTNIQLPVEYVSDAEVQQALRDGKLQPVTTDALGAPLAVRVSDKDAPEAITVVQTGTPEAGTELPPNSRPTHDAGMKPPTADDTRRAAAKPVKPDAAKADTGKVEGTQQPTNSTEKKD